MLAADPAPEVRIAAARRCNELATLAAAWQAETDAGVREAVALALGNAIADTTDNAAARALLEAENCNDAIRAAVTRRTRDAERRRIAILGMRDEALLIDLALGADHAETRLAAAQRVLTASGLRTLAAAANEKDHGVARLARQRLEALQDHAAQSAAADIICAQLETLAAKPGPILTAVVDLDRQWQALDMANEPTRLARHAEARALVQARFEREHEAQRAQAKFERALRDAVQKLGAPDAVSALEEMRAEFASLRSEAHERSHAEAHAALDRADLRLASLHEQAETQAGALAIVAEAELLQAQSAVDPAPLRARWLALEPTYRTPPLTQRFDAAVLTIEQRRLAQNEDAQQKTSAARQQIHALLHAAEQALAAGQLQAARASVDKIRPLKPGAGLLPKPTNQRLGRLVQQLVELERWESFGQRNARLQLCERAEALATQTLDAPALAVEVQKVRNEWKALDKQHPGVPKALWQRFDGACEKAYAPAARHFAELAARRKEARTGRDEFIAAAEAHATTLLAEPRDWRAIERWVRETEQNWREGKLGSVEPRAWKKFDTRFKSALGPLRDALAAARDEAKAGRQALITEATALAARAMERDTLKEVKALQSRWQVEAKAVTLLQRDERALWEEFRGACNAVFAARDNKRKEADESAQASRGALEAVCAQLEQLSALTNADEKDVRASQRDLHAQWTQLFTGADPALRSIETRYKRARTAVDAALKARERERAAQVWDTLAAKELLCDELDGLARTKPTAEEAATQSGAALEKWSALPPLPADWEKCMLARRDAALQALAGTTSVDDHAAQVEHGIEARRAGLLELEMLLGLDSPPEFQPQKLALQVKQLRDRFKSAATTGTETADKRLIAWCAQAGCADAGDRQRSARILAKVARAASRD